MADATEQAVLDAKAALAAAEQAAQNAKGTGVANVIAATKAVAAAKKELAAAERGVETANKTRKDVLAEQRAVDFANKAEARAQTEIENPVGEGTIRPFDIQNRPAAPPADDNFVYYYSWIGGATTGEWTLYRAANTPDNMAAYGSRAIGGRTKAEYGISGKGAQALEFQPQPIKNDLGQIIGWTTPTGGTVGTGTGGKGTGGTGGAGTGGAGTGGTGTGGTGAGGTGFSGTGFGGTGGGTAIPAGTDPAIAAMLKALQDQNNTLLAMINKQTAATQQAAIDAAAADAAAKKERTDNAILALTDRFSKYGLSSLIPKIRELAISGASEDTIALQLQETDAYKQRFIGNEERIKKGLKVLDPGTYLGLEDRYRQIIRAYGLKQFDNDSYVTQFISNDVSPEELSSRVVNAVQRVQNADPAVSAMLRQYYNIGVTDMVAYVLDPANQLPKIERQIGAAEIGVAAGRQGLTAGVNVAEQLAAQGITQAEAQRGYATIADVLPGATKLSQIYTGVLDQYGQAEAEQEVFNSLASAQRKRRALAEREIATFAGASGLGKTALDQGTRGNF